MDDAAKQLRDFMDRSGLTQNKLAINANVSQASVCRALSGKYRSGGAAIRKIFSYAGLTEYTRDDNVLPSDRVLSAFEQVWDGSDSHADALARLLLATSGMRPAGTDGGD